MRPLKQLLERLQALCLGRVSLVKGRRHVHDLLAGQYSSGATLQSFGSSLSVHENNPKT